MKALSFAVVDRAIWIYSGLTRVGACLQKGIYQGICSKLQAKLKENLSCYSPNHLVTAVDVALVNFHKWREGI